MRYLLGTLSEEERARMEERYFSDDAEFEELEIVEEELIDRYIRGELSTTDSATFEMIVARSPRLTERVAIAQVFAERLKSTPTGVSTAPVATKDPGRPHEPASWWTKLFGDSPGSRRPRLAVAFSILLVSLGGLGLLVGWLRLREESKQLAADRAAVEQRQRELDKQAADLKYQAEQLAKGATQASTPPEISAPKQLEQPTPSGRSLFAVTLSPGTLRSAGGGNQGFTLPSGTGNVEITLRLRDTEYPSYQATILNADRVAIFNSGFRRPIRRASGSLLIFRIPANRLSPSDYSISVEGRTPTGATESVDDYGFRVIR
jgi:hypothetical protein